MTDEIAQPSKRKVSAGLFIGVLLLPFVFAWFTLRKGYSVATRCVAFGWMILLIVFSVVSPSTPQSPNAAPTSRAAVSTTPSTPTKTPEQIAAEEAAAEQARLVRAYDRNPDTALELTRINGTKVAFETVLELSGTIHNKAAFDIKDAEIECLLTGPSGTVVGRVRQTLYEIIPAGGDKRFAELNMGFMGSNQVANFSCSIKDAAKS